jgi:hypothetical protein
MYKYNLYGHLKHGEMTIEDPALPIPPSQFQNLQTIHHQNPNKDKLTKTTTEINHKKFKKANIVHPKTTKTD